MDNEGYGRNKRLLVTVLTGKYSYLDHNEIHRAKPTTTATIPELMRYSASTNKRTTTHAANTSWHCCCQVCHFWSDFTMPATGGCQRKIDSEGYGINQRLKILASQYPYVDNKTHRAAPTRQGHNSRYLGAHALIGLNQRKNDHLRSMYVFVLLGVATAIPVLSFLGRVCNACNNRSLSVNNGPWRIRNELTPNDFDRDTLIVVLGGEPTRQGQQERCLS